MIIDKHNLIRNENSNAKTHTHMSNNNSSKHSFALFGLEVKPFMFTCYDYYCYVIFISMIV